MPYRYSNWTEVIAIACSIHALGRCVAELEGPDFFSLPVDERLKLAHRAAVLAADVALWYGADEIGFRGRGVEPLLESVRREWERAGVEAILTSVLGVGRVRLAPAPVLGAVEGLFLSGLKKASSLVKKGLGSVRPVYPGCYLGVDVGWSAVRVVMLKDGATVLMHVHPAPAVDAASVTRETQRAVDDALRIAAERLGTGDFKVVRTVVTMSRQFRKELLGEVRWLHNAVSRAVSSDVVMIYDQIAHAMTAKAVFGLDSFLVAALGCGYSVCMVDGGKIPDQPQVAEWFWHDDGMPLSSGAALRFLSENAFLSSTRRDTMIHGPGEGSGTPALNAALHEGSSGAYLRARTIWTGFCVPLGKNLARCLQLAGKAMPVVVTGGRCAGGGEPLASILSEGLRGIGVPLHFLHLKMDTHHCGSWGAALWGAAIEQGISPPSAFVPES